MMKAFITPSLKRNGHIHIIYVVLVLLVSTTLASTAVFAADDASTHNPVGTAQALVHSLAAGDYASLEANFNTQMQQGLPTEKLKEAWNQITAQAGNYLKTGETKTAQYQGDTIVLVKTLFKNGTLWTQVAFDKSGKVAGLYFKPAS
jgi:Protein of unknown function (DUF3887)